VPQDQSALRGRAHNNLLVLLKKAQSQFGCVPDESIKEIAQSLDVSISEAYGVATFYSFLSVRPQGKYVIRVCRSLPCYLKHSQMIAESIERELGVKPGQTTSDGKFSFQLTNCIGACDKAPAMLINDDVHGSLTPEKIAQILKVYK
jgi:NADH-quinone oxidoreductase E subunit